MYIGASTEVADKDGPRLLQWTHSHTHIRTHTHTHTHTHTYIRI